MHLTYCPRVGASRGIYVPSVQQQQSLTVQVQSFVTHVRFTEATAAIPKDAVLLEVGPHALLRAPLRQNLPGHQCAPHTCTLPPWLLACNVKGGKTNIKAHQAVLHTSGLHTLCSSRVLYPRLFRGHCLNRWTACRYCHTMKKGSNAVETVRECAADLWRKGAAMQWPVPAEAKAIGMLGCPIICPVLPAYL